MCDRLCEIVNSESEQVMKILGLLKHPVVQRGDFIQSFELDAKKVSERSVMRLDKRLNGVEVAAQALKAKIQSLIQTESSNCDCTKEEGSAVAELGGNSNLTNMSFLSTPAENRKKNKINGFTSGDESLQMDSGASTIPVKPVLFAQCHGAKGWGLQPPQMQ